MLRIVLIGSGRLAYHLSQAIQRIPNAEIVGLYSRNPQNNNDLFPGIQKFHNLKRLPPADLIVLAVTDQSIAEVSAALGSTDALVVHCSGATPLDVLQAHKHRGVFYPLQSFSMDHQVSFKEIPLCLEAAAPEDLITLKTLADALSDKVYQLNGLQRKNLHLAAVFANNFSNHMFVLAQQICRDQQIPFELLHPIILETAQKAVSQSPETVQTGPAVRSDLKTINSHLELLKDPEFAGIYQMITKSIQDWHGRKEL